MIKKTTTKLNNKGDQASMKHEHNTVIPVGSSYTYILTKTITL